MVNAIELKGVNKTYGKQTKTQVLFDVDLIIPKEALIPLLDNRAAARSTLLNIIGTLDRPTEGEVYINGKRTDQMNPREPGSLTKRNVGIHFSVPLSSPGFTALENVLMPFRIGSGKVPRDKIQRAEELLERVGLDGVKSTYRSTCPEGSSNEPPLPEH